jgi:hypothetical protein
LKTAHQALGQVQEHLGTCQASGVSEVETESTQVAMAANEADVAHWEQVRDPYRGRLEAMSWSVHPWRVAASTPQISQEVEAQLAAEVAAFQALLETSGLPVKKKVLDKVRKQLAGLAEVIDVWWQGVGQDVLSPNWVPPGFQFQRIIMIGLSPILTIVTNCERSSRTMTSKILSTVSATTLATSYRCISRRPTTFSRRRTKRT